MEVVDVGADERARLATVLRLLLRRIPCREWGHLRLVCQGWNHAVREELRNAKSLKVQDFVGVSEEEAKGMDHTDWVDHHAASLECFIEYMIKRHGKSVASLTFFDHGYGSLIRLRPEDVRNLAQNPFCSRLKFVDFTGVLIPWKPLFDSFLPQCVNIETLILRDALKKLVRPVDFDELQAFATLCDLGRLTYLDISGAKWFTGKALQALPASIESLILDRCQLSWKVIAKYIDRFERLRVLSVGCGITEVGAACISKLPALQTFLIDGECKCAQDRTTDLLRLFSAPESAAGLHLETLCFGAGVKQLKADDAKQFFQQDRTKSQLKVLEIHCKSFRRADDHSRVACLESIGLLGALRHLELSLESQIDDSSASILLKIFQGCKQLQTLAVKLDFTWPTTDQHMDALHQIGQLPLVELSWIMPPEALLAEYSSLDRCLDAISQELFGRLKRLRYGAVRRWPTREHSPHFQLLSELTELELVFHSRIKKPETDDLPSVLDLFVGNLTKISMLNCGTRKKAFRATARHVQPQYENVTIEYNPKCAFPFDPILPGGSVMGMRENLPKATSYAKIFINDK